MERRRRISEKSITTASLTEEESSTNDRTHGALEDSLSEVMQTSDQFNDAATEIAWQIQCMMFLEQNREYAGDGVSDLIRHDGQTTQKEVSVDNVVSSCCTDNDTSDEYLSDLDKIMALSQKEYEEERRMSRMEMDMQMKLILEEKLYGSERDVGTVVEQTTIDNEEMFPTSVVATQSQNFPSNEYQHHVVSTEVIATPISESVPFRNKLLSKVRMIPKARLFSINHKKL